MHLLHLPLLVVGGSWLVWLSRPHGGLVDSELMETLL